MIALVDNTVLSNFARVNRLPLLQNLSSLALSITPEVEAEFERGMTTGRLPASDFVWLPVITLTNDERETYHQLMAKLDSGEASCLAVAIHRQGRILTDDRDARKIAAQRQIPVSGTLGILVILVRQRHLSLTQTNDLLQQMINNGYYSPFNKLDDLI